MTYNALLDDLLPDTITVQQAGTRNVYGEYTSAGPATTLRARVVYTPRQIVSATGAQVVSSGQAWVSGTVPTSITPSSIVKLPDGSTPQILRVDTFHDEDGQHHQTVYF